MTDQELLERAARAAGLAVSEDKPGRLFLPHDSDRRLLGKEWNPLDDDGDAFRLAIHLGIKAHGDGYCGIAENPSNKTDWFFESITANGGCRFKATRRAIVRAAAALGEGINA